MNKNYEVQILISFPFKLTSIGFKLHYYLYNKIVTHIFGTHKKKLLKNVFIFEKIKFSFIQNYLLNAYCMAYLVLEIVYMLINKTGKNHYLY